MVTDLVFKHSLKILYLSFPICTSSKTPQVPKTSSFKLNKDVWTRAPVALAVLFKSASSTLPAQKISWSAKNCVAISPIGNFDKTILAPQSLIRFNFLKIISHSACTIELYSLGFSILTSAFSFSAFNSNSTFNNKIFLD